MFEHPPARSCAKRARADRCIIGRWLAAQLSGWRSTSRVHILGSIERAASSFERLVVLVDSTCIHVWNHAGLETVGCTLTGFANGARALWARPSGVPAALGIGRLAASILDQERARRLAA